MIGKREVNDSIVAGLLLLIFLLTMHLLKGIFIHCDLDREPHCETVFVQITGDVQCPGVYGFCHPPDLKSLLARAGVRAGSLPLENGSIPGFQNNFPCEGILFHSGGGLEVLSNGRGFQVFKGEMSAFNKITLGIPISLNSETIEGLTAVPGIGLRIAASIARRRDERGGFKDLEELFSVPGIGPALYRKITPYLVL
jgi:competence ComEA-like helix-hairpin-helix protein